MRQQDYLDVSTSPDRMTFERRLVRFVQNMDFDIASAALAVDKPGQKTQFVAVGNTPAGFLEASRDVEQSRRDPVLQRLKTMSLPFVYDQDMYVAGGAADLWEEQAAFGYRTGISMALHLSDGKHFLLGVDRARPLPSEDRDLTRLFADLHLLAVYAQETAIRVLLPAHADTPGKPSPRLTPREREVLAWTREGKSAWAVGQILSMSEHTVNYHLRNVMRKLDVSSKHLAILRALSLGLI
jgi:DNA-binding CsgD family transcriptional regulator